MAQKQKLTTGQGAIISCLSKYIHPSLCLWNHHVNIPKGHQLERIMSVLKRSSRKSLVVKRWWPLQSWLLGLWMMLIQLSFMLFKITSRSFLMVIKKPFTVMKAIMFLRRQQKGKWGCLLSFSNLSWHSSWLWWNCHCFQLDFWCFHW